VQPNTTKKRLSPTGKAVYALGDHTINVQLATVSLFFLFFLTEIAGLPPSWAGLVLLAGRGVDAVTDPLMGLIAEAPSLGLDTGDYHAEALVALRSKMDSASAPDPRLLADLELLGPVCEGIGPAATLHVVDGADHSFQVLKRSGRSTAEVFEELVDTTERWATPYL